MVSGSNMLWELGPLPRSRVELSGHPGIPAWELDTAEHDKWLPDRRASQCPWPRQKVAQKAQIGGKK